MWKHSWYFKQLQSPAQLVAEHVATVIHCRIPGNQTTFAQNFDLVEFLDPGSVELDSCFLLLRTVLMARSETELSQHGPQLNGRMWRAHSPFCPSYHVSIFVQCLAVSLWSSQKQKELVKSLRKRHSRHDLQCSNIKRAKPLPALVTCHISTIYIYIYYIYIYMR